MTAYDKRPSRGRILQREIATASSTRLGRFLSNSGIPMRIAFMSWRDLANEQAGGSEVFIDRLAVALMDQGHEVAHLCGGPVGVRPYPVFDMGGTFTQYARAPFLHHRVARDWDLLVDTENGLPYFSPLWRRKPILACVYHVHSEQWSQRFPPPLAAAGRFAEAKIMPLVYRRVPFMAISSSTASALERYWN